jgi:O-succinylbenzoic acid--CoA ligase
MNGRMPHPLVAQSRARPEHVALCDGFGPGRTALTYRALYDQAAALAAQLEAAGVAPTDRVGLVGPHTLAFAVALHGIGLAGAAAVPLPVADPASALAERLARAQATLCVALPETPAERLRACQIATGRPCVMGSGAHQKPGPALRADAHWALEAPLLVLQTSGTSGQPTQVTLTAGQILMQTFGSATRLGHAVDDVWWDVLPLHHVGGLMIVYRALLLGVSACVPGGFDAAQMARALQDGQVTLTSAVPTMLARMLPLLMQQPPSPKLRAVLLGGAPTPQALYDEALQAGVPVRLTWGMTEAASGICIDWPGARAGVRNAGPPLPFAEVWTDAEGALHVGGATVAQPFKTGDRGRLCPDGSVQIDGRRDRVIISGGENIAPEEVEAVLLSHGHIVDAAVVGQPDPLWGERPVAHLVALGPQVPNDALVTFCRARLASFQVPTRFVWHAQLPRDAMGKLQRASLVKHGG